MANSIQLRNLMFYSKYKNYNIYIYIYYQLHIK